MTVDGKPDYYRLDTYALEDSGYLSDTDKLIFLQELINEHENSQNPDYVPKKYSGLLDRTVQRMHERFRQGVASYMQKVNNNPSGLPRGKPSGLPSGAPVETLYNINQSDSNPKEKNPSQSIQSGGAVSEDDYRALMKEGFSRERIDEAVSRIDWNGIKRPYKYLLTVLKGNPQKQVSAQAYTQREYSADEESIEERMERFKAELQ